MTKNGLTPDEVVALMTVTLTLAARAERDGVSFSPALGVVREAAARLAPPAPEPKLSTADPAAIERVSMMLAAIERERAAAIQQAQQIANPSADLLDRVVTLTRQVYACGHDLHIATGDRKFARSWSDPADLFPQLKRRGGGPPPTVETPWRAILGLA